MLWPPAPCSGGRDSEELSIWPELPVVALCWFQPPLSVAHPLEYRGPILVTSDEIELQEAIEFGRKSVLRFTLAHYLILQVKKI